MKIDNLTQEIGELQKYETPKKNILQRILDILGRLQAAEDYERIKEELSHLLNALNRIDAVINGQVKRFKKNKRVAEKLTRQQQVIADLRRLIRFYQSNTEARILNETYGKIFEAIQSFITLSNQVVEKAAKKAA